MRHLITAVAAAALTAALSFTANAHSMDKADPTASGGHASHTMQHSKQEGVSATIGDLAITSAWARATLPGQKTAGAYLTVTNHGTTADRLIGAASQSAEKVEIHTMEVVNDIMTMRPVEGGLEIPASAAVELKPGGYHIMFMGVSEPFADGANVPVTLQFETAGDVELLLPVRLIKGHAQQH